MTAAQLSPTRYLTDLALSADIETTRKQLAYAGAFTDAGVLIPGVADSRLEGTWRALLSEAESRAGI
jgi:hypothetical protein